MSANFDFDLLSKQIDEAPTAGFGNQVTFGKCKMTMTVMAWKKEGDKRVPVKREWDGQPIDQGKGEYFQLEFSIDMSEFNAALDWEKKWWVDVRKSNHAGAKPVLTDWTEITEPSLISTIGKDYLKKLHKGLYVEIEDVITVSEKKTRKGKDKQTGEDKEFPVTAPKFVRVFKSAAECNAAREERFEKKDNNNSDEEGIPAKMISDVKGLISSLGEDQARAILEGNPFNTDFTVDELIEAAKAK